jgi:hypothetical protein
MNDAEEPPLLINATTASSFMEPSKPQCDDRHPRKDLVKFRTWGESREQTATSLRTVEVRET